ncbi:hypothetical protein [Halomicrobium salinisoli]|uniref:hypothetical protein n=1 Tax=Halomicrobium salinisoli TaxID=2878391 RepID=UPI001CEFEB1D|nr:hypothetical protein [Halomicrobium salinisoli]
MPSTRSIARVGSSLALGLALTGVAAAQAPGTGTGLDVELELTARFVGAFVGNLILGGLLVALGPRYATEKAAEISDDPGAAFVWGLLVSIVVPILLVLIAITIVGLVVTIPGLIVVAVVGVVGQAVSVVWIGNAIAGSDGRVGGRAALAGAAALAVPAAIPILGNLVTWLVGLLGTGVVGRGLYESWQD